jgi:ubiquinone/menaquinone biosynthesis C-methylase UbiE
MVLDYTEVVIPNETPYSSYQEHIHRYAFASRFTKDKTVLDIACGTGYGSSYLKEKGAKTVVGGDISSECLEFARKNYNAQGLNFVWLDAVNLPFPDEHFDVVVSFETIEHIRDYRKFLAECKRVLKKDGLLICSTPNKDIFSPYKQVSIPAHVREFRVGEFRDSLAEFFREVTLFGQRYTSLMSRTRILVFHFGALLLSMVPQGKNIKKMVEKRLYRATGDPGIAKSGLEISDTMLDERHKVLPYRKTFFRIPACITAVASTPLLGHDCLPGNRRTLLSASAERRQAQDTFAEAHPHSITNARGQHSSAPTPVPKPEPTTATSHRSRFA